MANEAIIINNPTSTPAAVSTGYQRQNTRAEAGTSGLDCSYVAVTGAAQVTLYAGGPIDYNGVLYSISVNTNLAIGAAGIYHIYLAGLESAATLTPTLTTNPGTFDPTKNGRYTAAGERILNWVIDYSGSSVDVTRLITPESETNSIQNIGTPAETWITANGTWAAPRSKYYTIYITGCGESGGIGGAGAGSGGSGTAGTSGGKAGSSGIARKYIEAGTVWTATFTSASVLSTTFTDGITTLSAGNAGRPVTGCDVAILGGGFGYGGSGGGGGTAASHLSAGSSGSPGGCSIYGGGGTAGAGGLAGAAGSTGGAGLAYGGGGGSGGGGGGNVPAAPGGSGGGGGAGYQGVIRIVG